MSGKRLIEVENIAEFRRNLRKTSSDVKKTVKEYDKKVAGEIAENVPEFVPVLTGRLQRSIKAGADGKGGFIEAGTGKRTLYAPPQHWGWPSRNIPRSGFMIRGLAKTGREAGGDIAFLYLEGLKNVLRQLGEVT